MKLSKSHNCQGAQQPIYIHIGAKAGQKFQGKPLSNTGPGSGAVVRRDEALSCYTLNIEGATMKLGIWWLESAARGGPAMLPLVNVKPAFEGSPEPSAQATRAGKKGAAA